MDLDANDDDRLYICEGILDVYRHFNIISISQKKKKKKKEGGKKTYRV